MRETIHMAFSTSKFKENNFLLAVNVDFRCLDDSLYLKSSFN